MNRSPEVVVQRRDIIAAHVTYPGFVAAGAFDPDESSELVGFGYGYDGLAGQWWHDIVAGAIGRERTPNAGCATASNWPSCTCPPAHQGAGLGPASPERRAVTHPCRACRPVDTGHRLAGPAAVPVGTASSISAATSGSRAAPRPTRSWASIFDRSATRRRRRRRGPQRARRRVLPRPGRARRRGRGAGHGRRRRGLDGRTLAGRPGRPRVEHPCDGPPHRHRRGPRARPSSGWCTTTSSPGRSSPIPTDRCGSAPTSTRPAPRSPPHAASRTPTPTGGSSTTGLPRTDAFLDGRQPRHRRRPRSVATRGRSAGGVAAAAPIWCATFMRPGRGADRQDRRPTSGFGPRWAGGPPSQVRRRTPSAPHRSPARSRCSTGAPAGRPRGGSGALSDALAARFTSYGGAIRTGDGATSIGTRKDGHRVVATESGEQSGLPRRRERLPRRRDRATGRRRCGRVPRSVSAAASAWRCACSRQPYRRTRVEVPGVHTLDAAARRLAGTDPRGVRRLPARRARRVTRR